MPGAELEQWRASRAAAGTPLPGPAGDGSLEAVTVTVDEVLVGGALLGYDDRAGRRHCAVRVLQTTLPPDATAAWAAAIAALEGHVRARGVTTLTTAVAPQLAGIFGATGYRATMTTVGKRLDPDEVGELQEDRRVVVRRMDAAEREQFVVDAAQQLTAGMTRAGVVDGASAGLDELAARLARLTEQPPPECELLLTGTVDGVVVGRLWATLVKHDGALDLYGNTIDVLPEHRGRRLTPSFLGAIRRHLDEIGVRDVHLRVYGHDVAARQTYLGQGLGITDVHLRKDFA